MWPILRAPHGFLQCTPPPPHWPQLLQIFYPTKSTLCWRGPCSPPPLGQEEPEILSQLPGQDAGEEEEQEGSEIRRWSCPRLHPAAGRVVAEADPSRTLFPSVFLLEADVLLLETLWDQTMLRSKDLCVSYAIVCEVAVKNLRNSQNTMLFCVFPLSSGSQSRTASLSIAEDHFSEWLFFWINPDKSKMRPSESPLRAERRTGCSLNPSSSTERTALHCPQPPLRTNVPKRKGVRQCFTAHSKPAYVPVLVQIKWRQDRSLRWLPEENKGES